MKTALAFDTLAYARRLKQAGVDEAQAEGVATKADIASLEGRIDAKLARLETRVVLTILGAIGMLFAALKLFGGA